MSDIPINKSYFDDATYPLPEAWEILKNELLPKVMDYLPSFVNTKTAWAIMLQILDPTTLIVYPFVGKKKNIVNGYSSEIVASRIMLNLQQKKRTLS
jgi:hypothetical protein